MNSDSSAGVNLGGDGSQHGDTSVGSVAGRDVYQGLSGDQLIKVIEQNTEFYLTLVKSYEKAVTDASRKLERLRDENDMWRAGEAAKREARQKQLDRRLNRIEFGLVLLALAILFLAWRLWPAITAVVALATRH